MCLAAKLVSQLVRLYGCLVLTIHCCFTGFPNIFFFIPTLCYKHLLHHNRFLAAVGVVIATSHLRCHLRLLFDLRVVYCYAAATWCVDYCQTCRQCRANNCGTNMPLRKNRKKGILKAKKLVFFNI